MLEAFRLFLQPWHAAFSCAMIHAPSFMQHDSFMINGSCRCKEGMLVFPVMINALIRTFKAGSPWIMFNASRLMRHDWMAIGLDGQGSCDANHPS